MSHQERTAVLEALLRQPQQQIRRKIGRLKSQLLMSILSAILTEQITLRGACRADAGTAESAQNEACPKGFQKSGEASACWHPLRRYVQGAHRRREGQKHLIDIKNNHRA